MRDGEGLIPIGPQTRPPRGFRPSRHTEYSSANIHETCYASAAVATSMVATRATNPGAMTLATASVATITRNITWRDDHSFRTAAGT